MTAGLPAPGRGESRDSRVAPRGRAVMVGQPALGGGDGGSATRVGSLAGEAGLSLIETVVAMTVTVVVLVAVYGAVRPALLLNRSLPAMADGQQRLRHAFDRLHADLMAAGRGTLRVEPGPLRRMLPPIMPYRVGRRVRHGEHRRVRSDAITTLSVSPDGGAEARLLDAADGSGAEVRLAPGPGCGRPGCGYRTGDLALVFDDRPAWALFRVGGTGARTLVLDRVGPAATAFAAGAVVAPVDVRHYYLDEERRQLRLYDGWRGDFPMVDGLAALRFRFLGGPAAAGPPCTAGASDARRGRLEEIPLERFTDGPWCGPAGSPFDADLLRVRAIGLDIRVESAAPDGAGSDRRLLPGPVAAGGAVAEGYRVTVLVAPPNLAIAGSSGTE